MDLVTLVTACALAVDPKLMHALVWHQSGGELWAVTRQGEPHPRVYPNMNDAIKETRAASIRSMVRVGLAGVPVPPSQVSASALLPCRNVAMAAVQISRNIGRCKSHPRLKEDPTHCAIAVYRGSWQQPDVKFATAVMATAAKGDAPNFDLPHGTSTEIVDIADDNPTVNALPVVDVTEAFAEQSRGWFSTLFPQKIDAKTRAPGGDTRTPDSRTDAPSSLPSSSSSNKSAKDRELFVRRPANEPAR